jgi:hypothetical protein
MSEASEWRPIDTETPSMTNDNLVGRYQGRHVEREGKGRVSKARYSEPLEYEWDISETREPTHWKPLPA